MSTCSTPGDVLEVLIDALLGRVQVTGLGLEAVRQVHGEAAMQLGLVIDHLFQRAKAT